ncbi:MAG: ABC transporter ATP-binding protein, partial [Myxococcaceae bacterium]
AGEIVAQGTEGELAGRFGGGGTVEVEVKGGSAKALEVLKAVPGVKAASLLREKDGAATFRVEAPLDLRPALARAVVGANLDLLRIDRSSERLEEIFLKLTHGKEAA